MHLLPAHTLSFLIRWIHVISMSILLAVFPGDGPARAGQLARLAARRFEFLFWLAVGLSALTGVGNLGAFGAGLPGPGTRWGVIFMLKLVLVVTFILLSLLRTLMVARLQPLDESPPGDSIAVPLRSLYAGTAAFVLVILFLAISLAHG